MAVRWQRSNGVAAVFAAVVLTMSPYVCRGDEQVPADATARWWKGNLHTHSFWSDGNDFPEMIAEWYRTRDYNFLALSDHNVLSEGQRWMELTEIERRGGPEALEKYLQRFGPHWVEIRTDAEENKREIRLKPLGEFRSLVEERGRFIMLSGEEISDRFEDFPVHMNATNLRELIEPLGGTSVRDVIANNLRAVEAQARRIGQPILVHLNHPNFFWGVTAEDLAAVVAERFFEVYNAHPGVRHLGDAEHPSVERIWDIANTIRMAELKSAPLLGLATDDSHTYHSQGEVRPGRGWVMVRARHLTPESLVQAIQAGDFYASSGVVLTEVLFSSGDATLSLQIEADGEATFTTQFIGTLAPIEVQTAVQPRGEVPAVASPPGSSASRDREGIGQVLATVEGPRPVYKLNGREYYVRAVVTSSADHVDPSFEGQKKQAWTQPVGWQQWIESSQR
jgi:hypothetical protein